MTSVSVFSPALQRGVVAYFDLSDHDQGVLKAAWDHLIQDYGTEGSRKYEKELVLCAEVGQACLEADGIIATQEIARNLLASLEGGQDLERIPQLKRLIAAEADAEQNALQQQHKLRDRAACLPRSLHEDMQGFITRLGALVESSKQMNEHRCHCALRFCHLVYYVGLSPSS
jgi:hypothetical protein